MERAGPSIDTFLSLAATLAHLDPAGLPRSLSECCARATGADAAAVLLPDASGRLRASAVTSEAPAVAELFADAAVAGPSLEAYRSGVEVVERDLGAGSRWPSFTTKALARGFVRVYGLPLDAGGQVLGALTLLQAAGRPPLEQAEIALVRGLALVVAIRLTHDLALRAVERHAARLQEALDSRVVIEQAKGMLAERLSLSPDESFDRLRAHARAHNLRLRVVARAVVEGRLRAL